MHIAIAVFVFLGSISTAAAQIIIQQPGPSAHVPPGASTEATAICPPFTSVTGGGFLQSASPGRYAVMGSFPTSPSGWRVILVNRSRIAAPSELVVYAVCR